MTHSDQNKMLAPCGMDCRLCAVYQQRKKPCAGCHAGPEHKPKHCQGCGIKQCPEMPESGLCCHCASYPCPRLKRLDARYRKNYQTSLLANLNYVREQGFAAFWQRQSQIYACPACGGLVCVHDRQCPNCKGEAPEQK